MSARNQKKNISPLIYDYLKKYQEDPKSRVFAPLAEAYRKSGLIVEAIEIAREGLTHHPDFVGGKVALARALFDQKNYAEVVQVLQPVTQEVPDNLVAQRLYAESNLMLGYVQEALGSYKMLLYFSPGDPETARIVQELEAQAYEQGALVLRTDPKPELPEYSIASAQDALRDAPDEKRRKWISGVEKLQGCLQKVERYRVRTEMARGRF